LWLPGRERLSWSVVFLGAIDAQLVAKAASDYAGAAQQAAAFVEEDAFNAAMFMTDAEQTFGAAQQSLLLSRRLSS
jgi:hypothetical protein